MPAMKASEVLTKTAQVLRSQQAEIRNLKDQNTKLAQENGEFREERRARELAKKAADRGIIDGGPESIDRFVKESLASDRSLDVIEEGIGYATGDFFGKNASDDEDGSSSPLDPISSLVLGSGFDYMD